MQDFQSIPGLSGRNFSGSDTPTRRFRNYSSASATQQHIQAQQPVKCPRCDSSNTKFCYYNNYNLSQPRHFCKACRRYWTKGGVLRNVPVGGGCRKNSKRSKHKPDKKPISASGSSSESSSNNPNVNADASNTMLEQPVVPETTFAGLMSFAEPGLLPEDKVVDTGMRGINGLEWSVDSGSLFDMTSSVDPSLYWSQNHWGDTEPSLYLP